MSPPGIPARGTKARFPRVSGDEPITAQLAANGVEFSPRKRG